MPGKQSLAVTAATVMIATTATNAAEVSASIAKVDARTAAALECTGLLEEDFESIPGAATSILTAQVMPGSANAKEYCAVTGYVQPQIQFEIRLPTRSWNGRYFQTGCGGFCGVVSIKSCGDALAQDFVVAAHNMGHIGSMGQAPVWGSDPALREDYGGRSTHVMAVVGKAIAQRFYGQRPAYSYFRGCSTGGREGLDEAQHHPEDFDGIIAGDPAFPGRLGAIANTWDAQHLLTQHDEPVFSPEKLQLLHAAVMRVCDRLDGLADGILDDPRACRFDVATLACQKSEERADCFTAEQVRAAQKLYEGPVNSRGERLMPGGMPFGSELAWGGRIARTLPQGYLRYLAFPQNPPVGYTYRDFNFDTDVVKAEEMARLYDPVAPHEAPDLRAFEARGGKLIMYHGWADAGIYPLAVLDYYAQVTHRQGGLERVQSWFRTFMVPGMYHCRGGDVPDTFDMLTLMMSWVEKGEAPARILATQLKDGRPVRTRPLFPYPTVARYSGKGDLNDAANWGPKPPRKLTDDRIDWIWAPKPDRKPGE